MKKLVKDLKDGDLVYVVHSDPDTVTECSIHIHFEDDWYSPEGYFTKHMGGILYSGKNKMKSDSYGDFQVFRLGTASIWDEECKIKREDLWKYYPCAPGGVEFNAYMEMLDSGHFEVYRDFQVFTDIDDAKNYIVDKKLEKMKEDLMKLIKVRRYKKKETE